MNWAERFVMARAHKNIRLAESILPRLKNKEKVAFLGNEYAYEHMRLLLKDLGATYEDLDYFMNHEKRDTKIEDVLAVKRIIDEDMDRMIYPILM